MDSKKRFKIIQIGTLCILFLCFFLFFPIVSYVTRREYGQVWRTESSLSYALFHVGLNHRYTYSIEGGVEDVVWDWGWRLDSSEAISTRPEKHGVVNGTGTVEYIEIEGGFYGIVGDDGDHYDPLGSLPQEFAVDALRVSFSLRICEDRIGIHMWGYIVEVLSIGRLP